MFVCPDWMCVVDLYKSEAVVLNYIPRTLGHLILRGPCTSNISSNSAQKLPNYILTRVKYMIPYLIYKLGYSRRRRFLEILLEI